MPRCLYTYTTFRIPLPSIGPVAIPRRVYVSIYAVANAEPPRDLSRVATCLDSLELGHQFGSGEMGCCFQYSIKLSLHGRLEGLRPSTSSGVSIPPAVG